ncbi:MAG TPA: hypothetical protein DEQ55_15470 [Pseudomonas sp.]|nr:hypothetical protein [Pseudomonas sp.]
MLEHRQFLRGHRPPRLGVDDAQTAQAEPFRRDQGHARIETNARLTGDQRVVLEAHILGGIEHLERLVGEDCIGAEGILLRRFLRQQPDPRGEPLALFVDDRDQCDRRLKIRRHHAHDVLEHLVGRCIQPAQLRHLQLTLRFIYRDWSTSHTITAWKFKWTELSARRPEWVVRHQGQAQGISTTEPLANISTGAFVP